jgi:electron transfer flavoprotein beta subunit
MNTCLVAVKKVINPYAKIKIKADLSGVDNTDMRFVINPFDNVALENAVNLKQSGDINTVTAISIGPDCQDILRQALAKGADRAIWIKTELSLSPLNIAKILQSITLDQKYNLVFLGKQAIDDDCNQTGQMLAGLLNWPQSCFTSQIKFNDSNSVYVERELDHGIEAVNIQLPAVITFELSPDEPAKISLPQLMQAKKKPLDLLELEQLAVYPELNSQQVVINKVCAPPTKPSGIQLNTAQELVDRLINQDAIFG